MPRDASGNYTLPAGNPVTPNTIIESVWANTTMPDLGTALTDSLSRTGQGGMLVPFRNTDGSKVAPGMTWQNEPSSGWYRVGFNDFWYSVGNDNVFQITQTGIALAPGKTATGIASKITIQETQPSPLRAGEEWYDSDAGELWMQYQNPDLTFSLVAMNAAGGDYATLDVNGRVPGAQLLNGFPIGAIYLTASNISPASFLGGTWVQIGEGRVLVGVGTLGSDTYAEGATGGIAQQTLTAAQLPAHTHASGTLQVGAGQGSHSHFIGGGQAGSGGAFTGEGIALGPQPSSSDALPAMNVNAGATAANTPAGQTFDNRQPYLAVYYWQRTA